MRRALIIGPGGLRGAYSGGAVATLCRTLGHGYFEKVYGCSAGAYTGSYAVSGQPDLIEAIWRECVHSNLLVDLTRVFSGKRPVLDLFYLNEVLRSGPYHLSIPDMLASPTSFEMVVTDRQTGEPQYVSPRSEEEFFLQVRASAAVPILHPEVSIGGRTYIDGGLSDPIPLERALNEGYDEIIVVCNRPLARIGNSARIFLSLYSAGAQLPNVRLVKQRLESAAQIAREFPGRIHVISPTQPLLHRWPFDSGHDKLNQLVDLGIQDAKDFLAQS